MITKSQDIKTYSVEFTDTFGGEANYCWVERFEVTAPNMQSAITKAKQHRYYSPIPRHKTSNYGDMIRIDIINDNVCAFIEEKTN